jgi:DNA mismatch repair protein MutS2
MRGGKVNVVDAFTLEKIEFDAVRQILRRFCRCTLGARLATTVIPSTDADEVARALELTSQMLDAVRDVGLVPTGGIADITEALTRAVPAGGATGEDFAAIASTLDTIGLVRAYLVKLPDAMGDLQEMGRQLGHFAEEVDAIRQVVGSDGEIRDDASERLQRIRREVEMTTQQVHDVIYSYLRQSEVRKLLQDNTVTVHKDRFVLPVRAENRGRLPGVVHRVSGSGATVFVEPTPCVELNNRLADLHDDERVEIARLLNELAVKLARKIPMMEASLELAAEVDLLSAKAQYAYQFDFARPTLTDDGIVLLPQARHPLLIEQHYQQQKSGSDQPSHEVVPIDVRLGEDFDILIITGSNTGGKTVCLKTVALLAAMAQAGMHIPTHRSATLPVFSDILIDIGDEQSLQQSLSTFGAHIARLKCMLTRATPDTLVLLDELGSGTDPDEGGAIGQAVLDELRSRGCKVMVTTHLSVLKAYAFNHSRVDNASVAFDTDTLQPTYHLLIGTPGESHAITVAEHLGLDDNIIAGAREHLPKQGKLFSKAIRATQQAREDAEDARGLAQEAKWEAQSQAEAYHDKLGELEELRSDFEKWLARLTDMKPGDPIYVPSLGKHGHLVRLQLHNQLAIVDVDRLQVEVPLRQLMPEFGQAHIRQEFAELKRELLEAKRSANQAFERASKHEAESRAYAQQLRDKKDHFEQWVSAIAKATPGDLISIDEKPGSATVMAMNFEKAQALVRLPDGTEKTLGFKALFPQEGKFSIKAAGGSEHRKVNDKPMKRGKPGKGKRATKHAKAIESLKPGDKIFLISFNQSYTLIRMDVDKAQAVVQSGTFELTVPLSDCRVARDGK